LETLLAEPDIIQETQSHNPKLIAFLSKRESLLDLVSLFFCLEMDQQRLPLIACEILACEIPEIIDAIVIDHLDVLQAFWNFLNIPYSSQATYSFQSSYFCKIITVFITKRTTEMLLFIKSSPSQLDKILSHLQSSAVMEFLFSLIHLEELPEGKGTVQWLHDHGLLSNLIQRLDPNLETDQHHIAQQCLCEIIRISQTSLMDSPSIGTNDLVRQLISKQTMQRLVEFMLDRNAPHLTSTLIHSVTVIIDLIRHNNSDLDQQTDTSAMPESHVCLADMLQVLTSHIHRFNQILVADQTRTTLGFDRLKICELYAELLHCSNMSSLNQQQSSVGDALKIEFVDQKTIPICIDLFFAFPWNNFLHYAVYDTLHQVFNGPMDNQHNLRLAISVFEQARLTDKIIEAQDKNDKACAQPKGTRLGYMGHLTLIADEIMKLFEGYPESVISAVQDTVDLDAWSMYCHQQLKETKAKDSLVLGQVFDETHIILNDPSTFNQVSTQQKNLKKDLDPFSTVEEEKIYTQKSAWEEKHGSGFSDLDLS
ncbi:hypothetical protein CU098_000819, partial [Rhizopus stolonifer]